MTDTGGMPQDAPASDADKVDGIIAQTRFDYPGDDATVVEERLRQRLEQSGIPIDETELADLVRRMTERGADPDEDHT